MTLFSTGGGGGVGHYLLVQRLGLPRRLGRLRSQIGIMGGRGKGRRSNNG